MTDLRKAAEMALKYFEDAYGLEDTEVAIKEALRQALEQPEQEPWVHDLKDSIEKGTKAWADVPNATEWVEELRGNVDAVNMSQKRVDETAKGEHKVCYEIPDWKPGMVFPAPKRQWVGLSVNEARKFYEKYTNREELIYAIDEFLEEKNHESTQTRP